MPKRHRIPPFILFGVLILLVGAELASGTSLSFVAMMAGTILCIGITYNMLGGAATFGGAAFSAFALCTIVISQFGKVFFFEAADKNLEAPQLTISIYLVFYACVMLGVFVFGRIQLNLPKPLEPVTGFQTDLIYAISLTLGVLANIGFGGERAHEFWVAFSRMLLFSIVIAVDSRIRSSNGEHSFGLKAFIPFACILLVAFSTTARRDFLIPVVVYFATCFLRGYHFRRRHYLAAGLGIVVFVWFLSPLEIYSRYKVSGETVQDRIYSPFQILASLPEWKTVLESTEEASGASEGRASYFSRPGTYVLSRLSMIRADSNLISACSGGYHYGFVALKNDLLILLPNSVYPDKPDQDAAGFINRVSGVNPDDVENGEATITAISDSFGAFGWLGVVLTGLIVFPAIFIVYENMFDVRLPWGTVAFGILCSVIAEASLGHLAWLLLRTPIELVLMSYLLGGLVRMIPSKGAREAVRA